MFIQFNLTLVYNITSRFFRILFVVVVAEEPTREVNVIYVILPVLPITPNIAFFVPCLILCHFFKIWSNVTLQKEVLSRIISLAGTLLFMLFVGFVVPGFIDVLLGSTTGILL